ncbi:MAG: cytochrome P450 [Rhodoferax sp.]|uniref:cytochrome P450 n=1 Tax=Rhodoferax sp. TaxID=50421 RepID=UPI0032655C49
MHPAHVFAAPTHTDPYPYYAALVAGPALVFAPELGVWIAARADVVAEVLGNPCCKVRPVAEPVPPAIVGTVAGTLFGQWLRMQDGSAHTGPKRALQRALAAVPVPQVQETTRACAMDVVHAAPHGLLVDMLQHWTHVLPCTVVARLLGFDKEVAAQLVGWMADFVACVSPLSTPAQLAQASCAGQALRDTVRAAVLAASPSADNLLYGVLREAAAVGWDDIEAICANLVGLLSQTFDATAGLVGNSIVALRRQPGRVEMLHASPAQWAAWVQELSRHDPPVQNTRRYVAEPTTVAGIALQPGDTIVVVLAAASRDPAVHARPHAFDIGRTPDPIYGFGTGAHACPGQAWAYAIVATALQELLQRQPHLATAPLAWRYRPSLNGRIPQFFTPTEEAA